ncbi:MULTISPECIES: Ldh family oxidoreductase [unclassified Massilia]|uniref:Ldh family oxidoreductase n=1 Tax=unclassified Massilia TaxID=2609279 RepID=UPI00177CB62D|nr:MULTISPECIES: Ldh family oxidoreductase [unclassified Massilia]MBD8531016.1 Ldh family oxidoreductase [Massilia sp. CFBP 13647]MBD8674716.1 Ldh family oxidoreductase [Massilia sp. CFBP 13721]
MDQETSRYCSNALSVWITDAFAGCGVAPDDAAAAAQVIVRTSLRGIDTHGVARVPAYVDQLRAGLTRAQARPRTSGNHGFLHCDGDGALGQLSASTAMRAAIDQAQETAIVAGTVSNSGHMGALGLYALQAAERGLIAFICQRTPPIMALPGATARAIGNNPIAYAFPVPGGVPLVFDMASSKVARGNVLAAVRQKAAAIPAGWAIDPSGQPTTDPLAALAGSMLPMSGHKGVGLAMLVEGLAGSLSGMDYEGPGAAGAMPGGVATASAFLFVINPDHVCGREAFDRHITAWTAHYLAVSGVEARYPGQRQARCEEERLVRGIPMDAELVGQLRQVGSLVGTAFEVERLTRDGASAAG